MIEGNVDEIGVPSIEIALGGKTWRAVIDTGFNGDVELPYSLKTALKARFIGRVRSLLAGGQIIDEDTFLVKILFDGELLSAEATFVEHEEILIGTHLLRNHFLEIDFPRQTVNIRHA